MPSLHILRQWESTTFHHVYVLQIELPLSCSRDSRMKRSSKLVCVDRTAPNASETVVTRSISSSETSLHHHSMHSIIGKAHGPSWREWRSGGTTMWLYPVEEGSAMEGRSRGNNPMQTIPLSPPYYFKSKYYSPTLAGEWVRHISNVWCGRERK